MSENQDQEPETAASFQAGIDHQREQIRLAFDPMLMPYVAPGYVPTPLEAYIKRLRELGYGV
jgi:hypothetical protein